MATGKEGRMEWYRGQVAKLDTKGLKSQEALTLGRLAQDNMKIKVIREELAKREKAGEA